MPISNDPTFPLFPIFSCLGFLVVLVPFPWHAQALNSGTCAFMLWTALNCLVAFVNSLVWARSVENVAPVWCDISTQILLGSGIGIPASILCISRRLYKIAKVQAVSQTREDKRKAILIDLCIAVGIPIIVVALHFIVQGHRFDIFEGLGCVPTTYNTLPAYFLYFMWPLFLGTISLVYSFLNLRSFYNRRLQFSNLVATTSGMNTSRYIRLMLLSCVDIMFTLPLGSYLLYASINGVPLRPWISWEDTHYDFGRVGLFPAIVWRSNPQRLVALEFNRWLGVFCAILFFALFGFASEAKKNYSSAFWWTAKKLGFRKPQPKGTKPFSSLPKYVPLAFAPVTAI
ncbi:STE3-like pheromone receptor [Marasmius fiardii PR-910]|nr:STE3-like pheromone receptor [Marasmius fiardii PR-910]